MKKYIFLFLLFLVLPISIAREQTGPEQQITAERGAGLLFGFMALLGLFWMMILGIFIGIFVFWILMLIDAAKRKFPKSDEQIVWILVIVLAGIVGALIYYFVVKRKDKK